MASSSISWLHLSDLHQGLVDQDRLWPAVRGAFFEDLERLHEKAGPWDLVLFTGDLTQRGTPEEFDRLTGTLNELWTYLEQLGSAPILIPVPGNHDLVRPDPMDPVVIAMESWHAKPNLQTLVLTGETTPYRKLLDEAFGPYRAWWDAWSLSHPMPGAVIAAKQGLLPGDISVIFEKGGIKLAIAGLNSAFLQLQKGDYQEKLALDARQLHAVSSGDPWAWVREAHAALILTHHPRTWLHPDSRKSFGENIAPPGWFTAHLFGHMHEGTARAEQIGGAAVQREVQAASLFGLETWGDGREQRNHGYSAGRVEVSGREGLLRIWPRTWVRQKAGHGKIVPDHERSLAEDDAEHYRFEARIPSGSTSPARSGKVTAHEATTVDALEMEVARYRQAIAADRGRGLPLWSGMDGGGEAPPDLLQLFVTPELRALPPLLRLDPEKADLSPFSDVEATEKRWGPFERRPSEPADQLLLQQGNPWILLLGGPGAGKSTLTEWLLLRLCTSKAMPPDQIGQLIPVRVELRRLAQRARSAGGRLWDVFEHLDRFDIGLQGEALRALADAGRIWWLFDGLDEVVKDEERATCATMIGRLKTRYGGRGLITSRIAGSRRARDVLQRFGVPSYALLQFDDRHIVEWQRCWSAWMTARSPAVANRRRQQLDRALRESPAVRALCATPLLLTLVASLTRGGEIPTRRSTLYQGVLSHLVDRWEAAKGDLETPGHLTFETKERFLRKLAWEMMTNLPGGSGNAITAARLERFAATFCEAALDQPVLVAQNTARRLVERLRDRDSALVSLGGGMFSFAHRALLDYAAAVEAVTRLTHGTLATDIVGELLYRHLLNEDWNECFVLLLSELLERRPDMAVKILQHALRRMALDELPILYFAAVAIRGLAETERLDEELPRAFALRLTNLVRALPFGNIMMGATSLASQPFLLAALRSAGSRWPGAADLCGWALQRAGAAPGAVERGLAYQLALATAPRTDRRELLRRILEREGDIQAVSKAMRAASLQASWTAEELEELPTIARSRGERVEIAVRIHLATTGHRDSSERLRWLLHHANDTNARMDAALFLIEAAEREGERAPWRQELVNALPPLIENSRGVDRNIAASWLEPMLPTNPPLMQRVRKWTLSDDSELQLLAAELLVRTGESDAVTLLERGVMDHKNWADFRLFRLAETSSAAREAIKRISSLEPSDDLLLHDLATWWADHAEPREAIEMLSKFASRTTDEQLQAHLGALLIDVPGGDAEGRSLLRRLALSSSREEVRGMALRDLHAQFDAEMAAAALTLAREASNPDLRVSAANMLATQVDATHRREGLRQLRALVDSELPDGSRLYAAMMLRNAGEDVNDVLADLAHHAEPESTRLDAARILMDRAALLLLTESAKQEEVRAHAERSLALLDARQSLLDLGRRRHGIVSLAGQRVGIIEELPGGSRFTYDRDWLARPGAKPIAPSMPLRHAPYESEGLLPFFENLLPEGWLLNIARRKLGPTAGDPFGLLLATCTDCAGAVEVKPAPDLGEEAA